MGNEMEEIACIIDCHFHILRHKSSQWVIIIILINSSGIPSTLRFSAVRTWALLFFVCLPLSRSNLMKYVPSSGMWPHLSSYECGIPPPPPTRLSCFALCYLSSKNKKCSETNIGNLSHSHGNQRYENKSRLFLRHIIITIASPRNI